MQLLLDTVTILWAIEFPDKISPLATRTLNDPSNQLYASVVSIWEISVKVTRKRIHLAYTLDELVTWLDTTMCVEPIDMTLEDSLLERSLPIFHADPFDRMLICQALSRDLVLVTPDQTIRQYAAASLW